MIQEPPIVQERRRDFMCICEDCCMPYEKAKLLSNCYINQLVYGSVYNENIEDSIKGIKRLMTLYNKPIEIVHDCLADKDKG